ncbi:MAG: hypothetical protein H6836_03080 [Planctomycetes bacterium]|nr:hypothetical protein [Planctomycetota bacterium]
MLHPMPMPAPSRVWSAQCLRWAVGSIALTAVLAPAQGPTLMGLSAKMPYVVRHTVSSSGCQATACSAAGRVASQASALAGGAAWDGRQGRMWVSAGLGLTVLEVREATGACGETCAAFAAPGASSASLVTGLEYIEAGVKSLAVPDAGALFLAYSDQRLGWAAARGCALAKFTTCDLSGVLGVGRVVAALAADDSRGFLLLGTSSTSSTSPANVIHVVSVENPCVSLCQGVVSVSQTLCPSVRLGAIRGMAYDGTTDRLFVTDGATIVYGTFAVTRTTSGYTCRFTHAGCCTAGGPELLTGLALAAPPPDVVGSSCTAGSCTTCSAMRGLVVGDAVLGNSRMVLALRGAPGNATAAVLGLGFGPCATVGGIPVGACAPIRVAFQPLRPLLFSFALPSSVGCTGQLDVPVAIPVERALLDLDLSAQWLLSCPGGGTSVTNCVHVRIAAL